MIQTIVAGGGAQAVEVYATDAAGRVVRPAGATVRIVDLEYAETADAADRVLVATEAATLDAVATTLTAGAGPREADPRKLALASAAGLVVGRTYGVTGGGQTEAWELDRIDGPDAYAREPLRHRFASGAAVVGLRLAVTFPGARADDADELARRTTYGVDWTITGTTGPTAIRSLVRIERRGRAPRAVAADVLGLDPQLAAITHARTVIERHIAQAELEVDARLGMLGVALADYDPGLVGKLAVVYRALELAYRVLGETHEGRALWAHTEAKRWTKAMLSGHQRDDVVETTRSTDRVRGRRRLGSTGVS